MCGFFKKKQQGLAEILHQKFPDTDVEERHHGYLKPFRILVSLLDKPEIGNTRRALPTRAEGRSPAERELNIGEVQSPHCLVVV